MMSKDAVSQIIEEYLNSTEFYLVDLKISPDNRIMVEIDAFEGISLDDCVALNQYIESNLSREVEDYELEVSSAGLTTPFKVVKQYQKNIGKEVEVITSEGKKMNGILDAVNEEKISLLVDKTIKPEGAKRKTTVQEEIELPFNKIKTTKLIIRFK